MSAYVLIKTTLNEAQELSGLSVFVGGGFMRTVFCERHRAR